LREITFLSHEARRFVQKHRFPGMIIRASLRLPKGDWEFRPSCGQSKILACIGSSSLSAMSQD
jgi:hypothetical protein